MEEPIDMRLATPDDVVWSCASRGGVRTPLFHTRTSRAERSAASGKGHELHEQRLTWDPGRRRRRNKGEWFGQVGR